MAALADVVTSREAFAVDPPFSFSRDPAIALNRMKDLARMR
jgi:hypothetical protein